MSTFIKTEHLEYAYTVAEGETQIRHPILLGVDLEIERGSFTAVLGRNGSGKSTLARHLNGILLPCGGKVWIDGMDTADDELLFDIRKRIGMVFQNPDNQIIASLVEEDVAFAPENLGLPRDEICRRIEDSLKAVGMWEYREHAPHLLSGGQKQRVAIAGVLAMRPECIVLDEPTAMLDPVGRREVLKTITQMRQTYGMTVVLITHHMDEAAMADRVVILNDGLICRDGKPEEVLQDAEALKELGLAAPESVQLITELRKLGCDLPELPVREEDCLNAIANWLAD